MAYENARMLIRFIEKSPTCFHVVQNLAEMLEEAGYREVEEQSEWSLESGKGYYVRRNGSSILAFRIPESVPDAFVLAAAHSDSPAFKVKENAEKISAGYVQLNTEKYGGMLMAPWFDRPLSVAGRIVVSEDGLLKTKLVDVDRDLLIIPSVAIHMNRDANNGVKLGANTDTLPLFGLEASKGSFRRMIAESAGVREEDILGSDLFLYVRGAGSILGAQEDLIAAPKLDDLECAWGLVRGFLDASPDGTVPVCCVFDNEEVGSDTKQGAGSALLRDTLGRIAEALGISGEKYLRMLSQSFMVSADNAHAMHPNHPEYSDGLNCPQMNGGIVIKYNANQKYTTDAVSAAVFRRICERAGVRTQTYANRSDMPGGSTLGSIADCMVPVSTVDIGLAQLAMHSCYETAGCRDLDDLVLAMRELFSSRIRYENGGITVQ